VSKIKGLSNAALIAEIENGQVTIVG